ncbi:hypothetical protein [Pseudomonas sp. zfem002]|uniref:hypothetical protein n=1 Tax=Pseudomonas sp. zfem002 TaxID=3078197 RepID=UPI00292956D2|nr:hypothetical protein [Pseudomonas sp. zfem002]MDU9394318.1 hypothetical protein [Pseudomonas sp. zfem002]
MQMQSANYVPGVSGMRLDFKAGSIEINGESVGAGSLPSEPQLITVTAGRWPENDLPVSAIEHYKFIGEQLMSIPAEHRESAELSTEDISFDRDGSDIRTTLTYRRLETEQEVLARTSLRSGSSITINGDGMTITHNGNVMARISCSTAHEPAAESFVVAGDQVFINQAFVDQFAAKAQIIDEASARALADDALAGRIGVLEKAIYRSDGGEDALSDALTDWKPGGTAILSQCLVGAEKFAVTTAKNSHDQYVCTGIGLGIDPARGETKDGQTQADMECAIEKGNASETLRPLNSQTAESGIGLELRSKIGTFETVRDVIRKELHPGGLLYRR